MHTTTRLMLVATLLLACPGRGGAAPIVRFENDRLTIRASDVPAGDLVAAIAASAGAVVYGQLAAPERAVRADIEDRPTQEALARVLGSQPFSLRYDVQGRLRTIVLIGTARAASAQVMRVPGAELESPIAVDGALAESFGERLVPFDRVVDTAMRGTDAGVRTDAARVALATLDADATLRTRFLDAYAAVRPEAAAVAMARLPGGRDFIRHLATHARSADLRGRAQAVLAAMRTARAAPAP